MECDLHPYRGHGGGKVVIHFDWSWMDKGIQMEGRGVLKALLKGPVQESATVVKVG